LVERTLAQTQYGWVSLGTYTFEDVIGEDISPSVELRDVTSDAGSRRTVLFDAVRWVEAGSGQPLSLRTFLRDHPEGAVIPEGSRVTYCYNVSRAVYLRWDWCNPQAGGCSNILAGQDNGDGRDYCQLSDVLSGTGIRWLHVEARENAGSPVIASDDFEFYVGARPNVATPTATATASPSPTATRTPPPVLPAGPAEAKAKATLVAYLEQPGIRVLGLSVPSWLRQHAPNYGYDERDMKAWLRRFESAGYPQAELDALTRAVLAEEAVQAYYDQTLELTDTSAEALVKLITAGLTYVQVIRGLEDWAENLDPLTRKPSQKALRHARELAADLLSKAMNGAVDLTVRDDRDLKSALKSAAAVISGALVREGLNSLKQELAEGAGRTLVDLVVMQVHQRRSQAAIDETTSAVESGAIRGSESTARSRVNTEVAALEADTELAVDNAEALMRTADMAGAVSDVAGIITLVTGAGTNPLSHLSALVSQTARVAELVSRAVGFYEPVRRVPSKAGEARRVAGLAIDPSGRLSALPEAGAGGLMALDSGPTGSMAARPAAAPEQLDAYRAALQVLKRATAAGRAAVASGLDPFHEADLALRADLDADAAPVFAAMREAAFDSTTGLAAAAGEVVRTEALYHGARLELELQAVWYLAEPSSPRARALELAADKALATATLYNDAIAAARRAMGGLPVPAQLVVRRVIRPATTPRPGEVFPLTIELLNAGGATALDVETTVTATAPLSLLSASNVAIGTVPVGGTPRLQLTLTSAEAVSTELYLELRDRSGQVLTQLITVDVAEPVPTFISLPWAHRP
jgi:hypothetical protein